MLDTATRKLFRTIDACDDDVLHAPSRLPDWTRAEVVAHLARNADGIRGIVDAAARGDIGVMYPGGAEQRAAGIAAGRDERAAVLRADLRTACDELAASWRTLPPDGWDRVCITSVKRTIREVLWVRWREVEIHHVDLGRGYEPSDWPVPFVSSALDEIFSTFANRSVRGRARVAGDYRITATDHGRSWCVRVDDDGVDVGSDHGGSYRGEVQGWGCDIAAWCYGRDPRGSGVLATGDPVALRLPHWFPFA